MSHRLGGFDRGVVHVMCPGGGGGRASEGHGGVKGEAVAVVPGSNGATCEQACGGRPVLERVELQRPVVVFPLSLCEGLGNGVVEFTGRATAVHLQQPQAGLSSNAKARRIGRDVAFQKMQRGKDAPTPAMCILAPQKRCRVVRPFHRMFSPF